MRRGVEESIPVLMNLHTGMNFLERALRACEDWAAAG